MKITPGPNESRYIFHPLQKQMNLTPYPPTPNENSSCAKVSTPDPAQRITIHTVNNGWALDIDFNAKGFGGLQLPQYVYTKPQEVAGAVLGLITHGVPFSGVSIPNEKAIEAAYHDGYTAAMGGEPFKVTLCDIDKEKEKSRAEGFTQCQTQANAVLGKVKEAAYHDGYTVGQKNPLGACDHAAAAVRAYNEGRDTAQSIIDGLRKANNEHARLKDLTLVANAAHLAEIKTLKAQVSATELEGAAQYNEGYLLGRKDERAEIFLRYPWREIDEKSKVIARHEETHRKLQTEVNRLHTVLSESKCEAQTARKRADDANERVNTAYENGIVTGRAQTMKTVSNIAQEATARLTDARLFVGSPAKPAAPEFQVGDVWRDRHGCVRCISSISPTGRFEYQHAFFSGRSHRDSALDARDFRGNIGDDAMVTRNAFSPAKFDGEPTEGFMVGDVWTSRNGITRTICRVNAQSISYQNSGDRAGVVDCLARLPNVSHTWARLVEPGATLVRK